MFFNIALAQDNNELKDEKIISAAFTSNAYEVFRINYFDAKSNLVSYLDSGITYRYGGTNNKIMDCSAFVGKVFRDIFQITLPRTSRQMSELGEIPDTLKAFDLLFFSNDGRKISHVGIYLGEDIFIHCSSKSGKVMISDLGMYKDKFMYGKRIIGQNETEFLFTKKQHSLETNVVVEQENEDDQLKIYQEGVASYYGNGFNGKKTASGERFNKYEFTAAHKYLPFGTKVKVTNVVNKQTVIVTINDRGPYIKGRIIDLSESAMQEIAGNDGICYVTLKIID